VPALIDGKALRPNVGQPRLTARWGLIDPATRGVQRGADDRRYCTSAIAPDGLHIAVRSDGVRPLVWAARVI
jgi:hypothetical protein